MQLGHLIILNGGSSAGKTSTCEAFQDLNEMPYVRLGIDRFWFSIPPKQTQLETVSKAYYQHKTYLKEGKPYFQIIPGPLLDKVMIASYYAIQAYLDRGVNVISDQIFWKQAWLKEALSIFKPYRVYLIGLHVSDDEGARREHQRGGSNPNDTAGGGRPAGWNRCSAYVTHQSIQYDLEIDNTEMPVAAVAKRIKDHIAQQPQPQAFKNLVQKFKL